MKVLSSIRTVLRHRNYLLLFLVCSLLFWILFGFLLGLNQLPWNDWNKLQNSVVWTLFFPNLVFIFFAGLLNGLLLALTVFRLKELQIKTAGKEAPAGLLGIGLTGVFAACPFCGVSVASVFGVSLVSTFVAPYYVEFQLLALLIVLVSLYWTTSKIGEECKSCRTKLKK